MPTRIEIQPEIAERLITYAKAKGVSVDALLRDVLDGLGAATQARDSEPSLTEFERDMGALAEGTEHLPAPYHGTYSREDIYFDHD